MAQEFSLTLSTEDCANINTMGEFVSFIEAKSS